LNNVDFIVDINVILSQFAARQLGLIRRRSLRRRESMSYRPSVAVILAGAGLLAATGWLAFQFVGKSDGAPSARAFFTTDDGVTLFADDAQNIPPFQKDGKTACLAHVFTCDSGKTKFVLYLERYTPSAKELIEADRAKGVKRDALYYRDALRDRAEVKPPRTGESGWVNREDEKSWKVTEAKCPDGRTTNIQPVFP
jgi:hypothetical protein